MVSILIMMALSAIIFILVMIIFCPEFLTNEGKEIQEECLAADVDEERELKKHAFLAECNISSYEDLDHMAEVIVRCLGQSVDSQSANSGSDSFEFANDYISIECDWRTLRCIFWHPDGSESKMVYSGNGNLEDTDDGSWVNYLKAMYHSFEELNSRYEHIDNVSSKIIEKVAFISKALFENHTCYSDSRISITIEHISDEDIASVAITVPVGYTYIAVFTWEKRSSIKTECKLYSPGDWEDYLNKLHDKAVKINAIPK